MFLENTQLLIGVVIILTLLLTVIGVQVFITLRDIRRTLVKANRVLDEEEEILENISLPIKNFSDTIHSFHTVSKALRFLFGSEKGKKVTKEISSHGREVLAKVEEFVEEFDEEPPHLKKSKNGNGETATLSQFESLGPTPLLIGRRFFKGIPKKR